MVRLSRAASQVLLVERRRDEAGRKVMLAQVERFSKSVSL
jgi:hypothetical protein